MTVSYYNHDDCLKTTTEKQSCFVVIDIMPQMLSIEFKLY